MQSFAHACTRTVLPAVPYYAIGPRFAGHCYPGRQARGTRDASVHGAHLPLDPHETSSANLPKVPQQQLLLAGRQLLLVYSEAPLVALASRVA